MLVIKINMEMRRNNSAEPREEVGAIIICERASRIRTAPQKAAIAATQRGPEERAKEDVRAKAN